MAVSRLADSLEKYYYKDMELVTIEKKENEKFLRQKTAAFNFSKFSKKEINDLIKAMRIKMKLHDGVGLAANQVGLNARVFVAQVDNKFYAIFNPEIIQESEEKAVQDEGCLSVPGSYGPVPRHEKVTLKGFDKHNNPIKIKAWGLLARVFQHEMDHLNGGLFIDRALEIHKNEPTT